MKKTFITMFGLAALAPAWSQDAASARLAYQDRQALAEVPRLVQQFDVLVENQEQIAARLVKVEAGSGDAAELRAEIDKLRGEIAELRAAVRRDQDAMRREIVDDLTRRLTGITQQMQQNQGQALAQIQARAESALQAAEAAAKAAREQAEYTKRTAYRPPAPAPASPTARPPAPARPAAPAYSAYYEHVVESGQTLSFIAKGYDTTVQKILAANPGLSAAKLRVGQKLIIPAEEPPRSSSLRRRSPRRRSASNAGIGWTAIPRSGCGACAARRRCATCSAWTRRRRRSSSGPCSWCRDPAAARRSTRCPGSSDSPPTSW